MDAGLDRRPVALRAVSGGEFISATDGAVHDVDGTARTCAELIDLGSCERFGDWRPR